MLFHPLNWGGRAAKKRTTEQGLLDTPTALIFKGATSTPLIKGVWFVREGGGGGSAPQTTEIDENDETGGRHSGKLSVCEGFVCQPREKGKRRFGMAACSSNAACMVLLFRT